MQGYKQLLRPGVSLLRHPGDALYTEADLAAAAHWLPLGSAHLWADVLALSGNDADNVPGVRGIGIKTAVALVRGIGGVEEVLAAAVAHDERLRDLDGVRAGSVPAHPHRMMPRALHQEAMIFPLLLRRAGASRDPAPSCCCCCCAPTGLHHTDEHMHALDPLRRHCRSSRALLSSPCCAALRVWLQRVFPSSW